MAKNKEKNEKKASQKETVEQENIERQTEKEEKNTKEETQEKPETEEKSEISEAEAKYNETLKKYNELNDKYLRLSAEYDNYRKRTLKEKMDLIKSGGSDVLKNILPVIDNFERALKAFDEAKEFDALHEGVTLIYKDFKAFLTQRGVTEIETIGKKFDTDFHEAIAQVKAENKEQKGTIIDVIEKGYILNEKVIRFAKVVVAQ